MKNIVIKLVVLISIGLIGIFKLQLHPFIEDKRNIEVMVSYKDKTYEFEVAPYTKLKDVLSDITLDDEVLLDAINENQILKHQDKIVIPIKQDIPCISINYADQETLMQIKGIGEKMAERIINYRNENGLFQSIEALKEVKGIGDKTFEKMKDQLCI